MTAGDRVKVTGNDYDGGFDWRGAHGTIVGHDDTDIWPGFWVEIEGERSDELFFLASELTRVNAA